MPDMVGKLVGNKKELVAIEGIGEFGCCEAESRPECEEIEIQGPPWNVVVQCTLKIDVGVDGMGRTESRATVRSSWIDELKKRETFQGKSK